MNEIIRVDSSPEAVEVMVRRLAGWDPEVFRSRDMQT